MHQLKSQPKLQSKDKESTNSVNDVIADKNVVTKIMNKFTGLQRIELNGFAIGKLVITPLHMVGV